MNWYYTHKKQNAVFRITDEKEAQKHLVRQSPNIISIHWNRTNEPIQMGINDRNISLLPNQITTTTYNQTLDFEGELPTTFSFNREFYCIVDHDQEVSCNGLIFFGTTETPIVSLNETERGKFNTLFSVFKDEFSTRDNIQGEMLRMLLKRLIIKITRLVKIQQNLQDLPSDQLTIIRSFNVLVEQHYRTKHQVSEYADLLFKSPKTLSNYFAKHSTKSPLQVIQDRLVLEAKRLLLYSDKNVKEIAFDLGFNDAGAFSKLFKKSTHQAPIDFRSTAD